MLFYIELDLTFYFILSISVAVYQTFLCILMQIQKYWNTQYWTCTNIFLYDIFNHWFVELSLMFQRITSSIASSFISCTSKHGRKKGNVYFFRLTWNRRSWYAWPSVHDIASYYYPCRGSRVSFVSFTPLVSCCLVPFVCLSCVNISCAKYFPRLRWRPLCVRANNIQASL